MLKFPKIGQFRQAITTAKLHHDYSGSDELGNPIYKHTVDYPTITFVGTVKLHGTNASVIMNENGFIKAQSRSSIITVENDNAGFARFVFEEVGEDYWNDILKKLSDRFCGAGKAIGIYGEWCGQGIQNGVAISNLPKMFVVFGIRVGGDDARWFSPEVMSFDSDRRIYSIMDFPHYTVNVDFNNPIMSRNLIVEHTISVENECPVGKFFKVSGIGEGIVWKHKVSEVEYGNSNIWFKTKGDKHNASKVKTIATVDTERLNSINSFVEYAVTENRLNQGVAYLKEMNKPVSEKSTGDFIKWVTGDIFSEESDVLEKSGLSPKDVGKALSKSARVWFFKKLNSQSGIE